MDAYPLSWPEGWPRAATRVRAKFNRKVSRQWSSGGSYQVGERLTIQQATDRVLRELRGLGASDWIISTNLQLRLDGLPRSGQAAPRDPGAAVYWQRSSDRTGVYKVMAIDIYDRVEDNLAAIAATLEAMRAIERHGGAQILERAFTGFTALPAPGQTSGRGWREILGFTPDAKPTAQQVETNYRTLRSQHHPDKKAGDGEEFHAIQLAVEQARSEIGAP